jgi:DNA-binding MarR family transcriptional regulator
MEESISRSILALKRDFSDFCNRELAQMGLAPGLMFFVIYLGRHPESSPGKLAAALKADTGHTARSVEKLVQGGFVERRQNPQDHRAFLLSLTPQGMEAFDKIRGLFARWDQEALKNFSPQESAELRRLLGQIVRNKQLNTQDCKEEQS